VAAALRHKRIFAEWFEGRLEEDFAQVAKDEKPAVLAEVHFDPESFRSYEEFLEEFEDFVMEASEIGYWVFVEQGRPAFFDVYVSKLRSVGLALRAADVMPTDYQSGAIGLLLGYPYREVLKYAKRNAPLEFR
jgi:hypothetical protein